MTPKRTNLLGELRSTSGAFSFSDFVELFQFGNTGMNILPSQSLYGGGANQELGGSFQGLIEGAYKANGVVFACELARMLLFSEARFQYRRLSNGRPGDLFGDQELAPLEAPGPGRSTGDLLTRAILDVDLAGNWYGRRLPQRDGTVGIQRLRPDWVVIVLGSELEPNAEQPALAPDADVVGYIYQPGGLGGAGTPVPLLAEEVAHFAPIPDPAVWARGMSWLVPVIQEILGDNAGAVHKTKFFENGATPNLVVSMDPAINQETFAKWIEAFDADHAGFSNAYKTMYLAGGADVKVVGSNLRQVDFSQTQAEGENRICMASGVPPVIVGASKGLDAATYSNYAQARRRFADGTMRPLWRNFASSVSTLINVPGGAELWYDDRDIPFLREDAADVATIQQTQAATLKSLTDAGFTPDSAREAVLADDFSKLVHSGMVSVQLFPPGQTPSNGASSNGGTAADQMPAMDGGNPP